MVCGQNRDSSEAIACDYRKTLVMDINKHTQITKKTRLKYRHICLDAGVQADIFDRVQIICISRTQFPLIYEFSLQ
jgi:hypothetical protein